MLFQPCQIGPLEVQSRFLRSATYEGMADPQGFVTPELVKLYRGLGRGGIGAIITGYMFVERQGRGAPRQMGIHTDEMIPGLTELSGALRAEGSRAIFQLHHAGAQTTRLVTRSRPVAPSRVGRDPLFLSKPRPLRRDEIAGVVRDFGEAARRARAAGADGVQLHAAHGYLLSEFLSPAFNHRMDEYGGSPENRYRILGEIVRAVRAATGSDFAVLVKMNVEDGTPTPGMTTELAADYAGRLAADGIDGLEISAGSTTWAPFVMSRGTASSKDYARAYPWPIRPMMRRRFERMAAQGELVESYNAHAAAAIKEALGDVSLAVVGGIRTLGGMQHLIAGATDLISLCRPFIRQPRLIQHLRSGKAERVQCSSCNQCLAGLFNDLPLACYEKGLPRK